MANQNNRGGSHEQHVRAGEQSHKNDEKRQAPGRNEQSGRGGSQEQNAKSGQQNNKNQ